jgi:hypothetical protein
MCKLVYIYSGGMKFRLIVIENRNRAMDNVQNCDSYINIPSSQTYG